MLSHYELAHRGIDLTTPRGLARLLRHPELWPRGFEWNYLNAFTCAMALLYRALDLEMPAESTQDCVRSAGKILDLDFDTAWDIFCEIYFDGVTTTPEMVAHALDHCATRRMTHARKLGRREYA